MCSITLHLWSTWRRQSLAMLLFKWTSLHLFSSEMIKQISSCHMASLTCKKLTGNTFIPHLIIRNCIMCCLNYLQMGKYGKSCFREKLETWIMNLSLHLGNHHLKDNFFSIARWLNGPRIVEMYEWDESHCWRRIRILAIRDEGGMQVGFGQISQDGLEMAFCYFLLRLSGYHTSPTL